jgi:hypothetical protein
MRKRYVYSDFRRDMTGPVVYAAIAEFGLPGTKFVKVGHTHELVDRLAGIQTGCPVQIGDVAYAKLRSLEAAREAERLIHRAMQGYRSQGEWFRFNLDDPEHGRVWRGAIPAVLNHVSGKGRWELKSINYGDIREAMASAKRARYAKLVQRRKRMGLTGTAA